MADANQLKIEARREEAAGDYEQASRLYLRALSAMDEGGNLSDPSLLVRVADLEYRQDNAESALDYYLQAVDEYAEQGLITNAIAVCNKILRVFPDQVECHRRLADLHMDVGLAAEARQNLLRFADEAWDPANPEAVLEAMRSFLERTPDQEVALRLASHLQELGREEEALDALEAVWEERTRAGADVRGLKRKAEEIHSGARVDEWSGEDAASEEAGEAAEPSAGDAAGDARDEAPAGGDADADAGGDEEAAGEPGGTAGEEPGDDRVSDAEWAMGVTGAGPESSSGRRPPADGEDAGDDDGREEAAEEAWADAVGRAGGKDAARDGEAGFGNGREPSGDPQAGPPGGPDRERSTRGRSGPDRADADRAAPSGPERELELVASYRERLMRFAPPHRRSGGPEPAAGDSAGIANGAAPGSTGTAPRRTERIEQAGEPGAAGAPGAPGSREEPGATPRPEEPEATEPPEEPGAPERPEETDETQRREASETAERPVDGDVKAQREEEIMEELNELDRASDVATADSGGWGDEPAAGGDEPRSGDEERPPMSAPRSLEPEEELGEEAELRRGLELVDEMLEVQPDNLELRERKLRYARRLGDRQALVDASLEFADALAKDDARRSARALYRRVLELDPENPAAESGLARLDVGELEEKRQSGKRAGADHATPRAASPEEQEARRELGMRLWTEFENSIREMPWLHAATQAYQSTDPEALPPLETFEMLAHYLMARERYRDAADTLERALALADEDDEQVADVLYHLGRAYEKLGEEDRAATYYDRLQSVDPDFARIRETLADADGS